MLLGQGLILVSAALLVAYVISGPELSRPYVGRHRAPGLPKMWPLWKRKGQEVEQP